ncbi:LysR family transcriptional regulator [Rhizobium sp. AAP43]|uniref:LysR family transcriptional regulator n=1 Tax=Rhizobium sp. AAP43 TaxID=1523420 RepID=UPI0006B97391|nr:LysR family transcriptional regulator [Rhizobium sp. AAP43]KPF42809.1 LysR family transcriptional regulator [Rhizobium sp. AAP43]
MIPTERLKGIEAFVQAAQTGSFTAAAEKLNLTNSAIGKSVGRLEARLGRKLFERTTRRLVLTDAGAAFHAVCVRVLADLADAEAILAAGDTELAGRLRIDVPVAFGHMQVMPLILNLAQRFPKLKPEISFTDRFVDIIEDRIDIAVRISAPQAWPDALGSRYLGRERLIICAAPDFIERHGLPTSGDDISRYDSVIYGRSDGSTIPWQLVRQDGQVESRAMNGRILVGSAEAQLAAVRAGFGIAQLATWLAHDDLAAGRLVEVFPDMATDGLPLHLIWPRSRHLSAKVDAALAALSEGLRIR